MMQGKVKWFSNKLGYGFIVSDDLEGDVFVHQTEIQMEGYRTLNENDIVTFDLDKVDGKAKNVIVVKSEESETATA